MTDFQYALKLFVNGATGRKTDIDNFCNVDNVLKISKEHNMYYSVLSSLLMCDDAELGFSEEKASKLREDLKNMQLKTYVRMIQLSDILKQFENENIPYALLKGITVAFLYNDPYSRVSSDIDLLVNLKDEKRATKLLLKNGFIQKKLRTDDDKHGILVHPVIGMLELHISLYNESTSEIWFEDAKGNFDVEMENFTFENLCKLQVEDMHFYTLEINKRTEYLFLHNVKHFILGGSSIRAIMDFFLTYTKCSGIDYDVFTERIEHMRLESLFSAMLAVVEKFSDAIETDVAGYKRCDKRLVELFLEDMETGKWLGYGSDGTTDASWKIFVAARNKGNKRKQGKIKMFLGYIFPPVSRLRNNYKYAINYPVLLPVAWIHRILRICLRKSTLDTLDSVSCNRVELFKEFNLI